MVVIEVLPEENCVRVMDDPVEVYRALRAIARGTRRDDVLCVRDEEAEPFAKSGTIYVTDF